MISAISRGSPTTVSTSRTLSARSQSFIRRGGLIPTFILTLALTLALTHTHTFTLTLALTLALTHIHTFTLTLALTLALAHTHTFTLTLALTLALTHTLTLTLALTLTGSGTLSQLHSERDVCAAARELGRVVRPGGRAMIISVPKPSCAATIDAEWDCPRCYWRLRGIDKSFWSTCLVKHAADGGGGGGGSGGDGGGGGGAYRLEFIANTALFPSKSTASYCHREH